MAFTVLIFVKRTLAV